MQNVFPHRQKISDTETKNEKNLKHLAKFQVSKKRATDSVAYCNVICGSYRLLTKPLVF